METVMERLSSARWRQLGIVILIFVLTAGCTAIRPPLDRYAGGVVSVDNFNYSSYEELLDRYVDEQGLVDYDGLLNNPDLVDLFYGEVAAYSPDSHPHLFIDDDARLAYWINSYNLTTIKGVLHNYPISSVEDVAPPALLFFFPSKSGFFFFQRFTYGGVETSLYSLENSVIRKRFVDPRYHFALNCASSSCPKLPRVPFYPDRLDEQLEMESEKFINSAANVRYDAEQKTLYLSAIFDWYEKDFLNWLDRTSPGKDRTIVDYLLDYLDEETAAQIRRDRETLKIDYLVYDWGLNDQGGEANQSAR
jgi:hypothetical protein